MQCNLVADSRCRTTAKRSQSGSYANVPTTATWGKSSPCPVGSTILTYSESANPASPHFVDQTKLFSNKQFLPDRFCPSQIAADPGLQVVTVSSR